MVLNPRWRTLLLVLAVALLATACSGDPGDEVAVTGGGQLPDTFPEDFPLPPGAIPVGASDVATLQVPGASPDELVGFFASALPGVGWEVLEDWDGVDIGGAPTSGLILQKGDETGALALTETDDGVLVRVNLRQPTYKEMGPSMGGGGHEHGPAPAEDEPGPADGEHGPAGADHDHEDDHDHAVSGDE